MVYTHYVVKTQILLVCKSNYAEITTRDGKSTNQDIDHKLKNVSAHEWSFLSSGRPQNERSSAEQALKTTRTKPQKLMALEFEIHPEVILLTSIATLQRRSQT